MFGTGVRPWLTIFGMNWLAMTIFVGVIAWWSGNLGLLGEGVIFAAIAAAGFTARLSWGWVDKQPTEAIWRYRLLQAAAIWGVVLVILIFVLLGTK